MTEEEAGKILNKAFRAGLTIPQGVPPTTAALEVVRKNLQLKQYLTEGIDPSAFQPSDPGSRSPKTQFPPSLLTPPEAPPPKIQPPPEDSPTRESLLVDVFLAITDKMAEGDTVGAGDLAPLIAQLTREGKSPEREAAELRQIEAQIASLLRGPAGPSALDYSREARAQADFERTGQWRTEDIERQGAERAEDRAAREQLRQDALQQLGDTYRMKFLDQLMASAEAGGFTSVGGPSGAPPGLWNMFVPRGIDPMAAALSGGTE